MFVEEQPRQATPLMKQGDRFVVGLVGYKWAGVASGEWGITTTLEDCKHGSETQASLVLARLHAAACSCGHLPEKLFIGADNTPKETKNTTFVVFLLWLLCCIGRKTALQEVQLEFPMVGHTHAEIDRFFSRVMVSLRGKTFCTFDEMRDRATESLKGFQMEWGHHGALATYVGHLFEALLH